MSSIINTGISALTAFKRQMETTGHNIANVNTEGYSRQRVDLDTRPPTAVNQGYIGSGVEVDSIRRMYDQYLALRVRNYTSSTEEFSVYYDRAKQIDNVVADSAAGVDGMMQNFFAALGDVANDPTSLESRAVLINRAEQMADRFQTLDRWFTDLRYRLNQDIGREVDQINSIASSLVEVNRRVGSLNGLKDGIPPDILDQRDQLVQELSKYINVNAVEQTDGAINVFIGTGQALVVGVTQNQLTMIKDDLADDYARIAINQAGGSVTDVTEQMTGGSLAGLLRFRDEILDETHNALGRVALGVATYVNEQHRQGIDLNGDFGGDLFGMIGAPQVLSQESPSLVTAAFTDISDLTTHEYELERIGAGNTASDWRLVDLTTGSAKTLSVATSGTEIALSADIGFSMTYSTSNQPAIDGKYRIRPTREASYNMDVLISDERKIAAAMPFYATAGEQNRGTGTITNLTWTPSDDSSATTPSVPVSFEFDDADGDGVGDLVISGGSAEFVELDAGGNWVAVGSGSSVAYTSGSTYNLRVTDYANSASPGIVSFTLSGDLVGGLQSGAAVPTPPATSSANYTTNTIIADHTGVPKTLKVTDSEGSETVLDLSADLTDPANWATLQTQVANDLDGVTLTVVDDGGTPAVVTSLEFVDEYPVYPEPGFTVELGDENGANFSPVDPTSTSAPSPDYYPTDSFTIGRAGVGDNRNARNLADLQGAYLMVNGTATLANTYSTMVAHVGTRTQQAQTSAEINENLLGQAEATMSEVSGVNLDEEAADLIRFQQAYQAAAQVITVANTLFDSLLAAVRR
jgi:flagellar hook-associated protein 1 FlgK